MVHTISEILFANLDVATGNLSWAVIYLAMNGSVQNQLLEEINQNSEDIEQYCTQKDTLLSQCLLETFRLRPFTGESHKIFSSFILQVLVPNMILQSSLYQKARLA